MKKEVKLQVFISETNLNRWLIYDHYNCKSNIATCSNKHSVYEDQSGKGEELNKVHFVSALQNGGNSGLKPFSPCLSHWTILRRKEWELLLRIRMNQYPIGMWII